ncbi:Protein phosphatase 1 regulatory subunit 37 [Trichoplax sp. H2]|nr:Protein phosphatase 1 regulatory subunit 37 [Trichoplax sp. H2]|eukprot:RDD47387.1 Protein phosphatase 1 regulatory subunit 37 [Trichoplax sp. H2]
MSNDDQLAIDTHVLSDKSAELQEEVSVDISINDVKGQHASLVEEKIEANVSEDLQPKESTTDLADDQHDANAPTIQDNSHHSHPQQYNNDDESLSSGSGKKIVKFSDENLVSGVAEVKDPLIAASATTASEMISAYRQSCAKLRVKPIEKLIQQLENITDFDEPQAYLNLKDARLADNKTCETLEEIFKRARWITIDIENTSLDDEGAIALFEMFEYYHSTMRLSCGYNPKIRLRGWHAASRMIKKTSIEYFDMRNTTWTEQSIPLLARTIRAKSCLSTLHMENTHVSGRPLFLLASALKLNEALRDLFIGDNKLVSADAVPLANMLRYNSTLSLLDLRNNIIQDVGLAHLCQGLAEQPRTGGLATIVLWNNQITHLGMKHLARSLPEMKHLETLNLGCNRITNEGIHIIRTGLLKNRSLLRLGLMSAKITCQGVVPIAEVIADNKRLIRLDLRENDIRAGGLLALSLSLKINESLTRLDIDKDPKKEPGHEVMQQRLLADIYSYCQRNKMKARRREYEILEKQTSSIDSDKEDPTPHFEKLPTHSSLDSPRFISPENPQFKGEFEFEAITHQLASEKMNDNSNNNEVTDSDEKSDDYSELNAEGDYSRKNRLRMLHDNSDDEDDIEGDEDQLSRSPDDFEKEMDKVIADINYASTTTTEEDEAIGGNIPL